MAGSINKMGKVPSLTGGPAKQALKGGLMAKGMPIMPKGKVAKSIKGTPPSISMGSKQPKGKAPPSLKKGTVKGITRKAVANIKGGV